MYACLYTRVCEGLQSCQVHTVLMCSLLCCVTLLVVQRGGNAQACILCCWLITCFVLRFLNNTVQAINETGLCK